MQTTDEDKPQYNEDTFPWYGRILEWVLLRVTYFVIGFGICVYVFLQIGPRGMRTHYTYDSIDEAPDLKWLWIGIFTFSILVSIFGPWLYKKHRERGLGKLQEFKAMEREVVQKEESDAEFAKRILEEEER